jgi:hypothetical protein
MIVAKLPDGCYMNDRGDRLPAKDVYQAMVDEAMSLPEPSAEELIELGKQMHPFYHREGAAQNAINMLIEIEAFEAGLK